MRSRATIFAILTTLPIGASASIAQQPPTASLASSDLSARARAVEARGELRLVDVSFPGKAAARELRLERFEVVAPDARIVVHGHDGDYEIPFPADVHFRGEVEGEPGSLAVLAVHASGAIHGMVSTDDGLFTLGPAEPAGEPSARVEVTRFNEQVPGTSGGSGAPTVPQDPWTCANETLQTPADPLDLVFGAFEDPALDSADARHGATGSTGAQSAGRSAAPGAPAGMTTRYNVDIAFDTDFEFWALFGDDAAAASYITTLAAAASTIFDRDVDAVWRVARIDLYNGGPTLDPWQQTGSHCALFEVGNYWQANRPLVDRDLVHFLSGKNNNSGIAWVGVLCSSDIACSPVTGNCGSFPGCNPALPNPSYAGGYAVSAGIDGNYGGSVVWDIVVVTHEGGHNFDSPHTHCYENYPNAGDPVVDTCYNLGKPNPPCWNGAESLPGDGGSIMSYCHTMPGGLSNINLYLGRAGWYGTNSERVQNRIRAEIESNAWCLDVAAGCGVEEHLATASGVDSGAAAYAACSKLVFTSYESQTTASVTGTAPLIELENASTLGGTVTLDNASP